MPERETPRSAIDSGPPLPLRRPLEASVEPAGAGWRVRLPVRVERVHLAREVQVYEEVELEVRDRAEPQLVRATVRREHIAVAEAGDVEVTQPVPHLRPAQPIRRTPRRKEDSDGK